VQSEWRVACVRIPRFPIGAVWRAARRGETGGPTHDAQLLLPLTLPDAAPPRTPSSSLPPSSAPPSPAPEHWDEHPVALIDAGGKRLRAVTAAAGRFGVRAGMRPAEARALCADLVELPWDDVAIEAAITEASAAFLSRRPTGVTSSRCGRACGGSAHPGSIRSAASARWRWSCCAWPSAGIRGRAWRSRDRASPRARRRGRERASINARRSDARARRAGRPRRVVPRPAPLALVPMDEELRAALHALGLRTVGALAALTAEDVERRWGDAGIRAWRLARADDLRRPVLARVETQPAVEVELASPSSTMEPVLFLVRAALDRLVQQLVAHGRAAAAVAITLTLDDARGALPSEPVHTVTREVRPARRSRASPRCSSAAARCSTDGRSAPRCARCAWPSSRRRRSPASRAIS
jgi:protein ImuB